MEVIKFAHDYITDRERVFKALESCETIEQLEIAENYFKVLKKKWSDAMRMNALAKLMFEVDEEKFMTELKNKGQ